MRMFREYFKDENKNAFVPGAERVPPISEFSTRLFLRSSMAAFMKGMCDGTGNGMIVIRRRINCRHKV